MSWTTPWHIWREQQQNQSASPKKRSPKKGDWNNWGGCWELIPPAVSVWKDRAIGLGEDRSSVSYLIVRICVAFNGPFVQLPEFCSSPTSSNSSIASVQGLFLAFQAKNWIFPRTSDITKTCNSPQHRSLNPIQAPSALPMPCRSPSSQCARSGTRLSSGPNALIGPPKERQNHS